jgi:hypothetical protein
LSGILDSISDNESFVAKTPRLPLSVPRLCWFQSLYPQQ